MVVTPQLQRELKTHGEKAARAGQVEAIELAVAVREEEFTPEIVNELCSRARDVLITQAPVSEEVIDQAEPAEDLLSLEGMDKASLSSSRAAVW